MRIEFKINGINAPFWTGDLGVPIPRKGEALRFWWDHGRQQLPEKANEGRVVDVIYNIHSGTGRSDVEVIFEES